MCYPHESDLPSPSTCPPYDFGRRAGEEKEPVLRLSKDEGDVPQDLTANPSQTKRKRGGQKGNRNARKHGFYSATLSPAETRQLWDIMNLEGADPEIALIRVKLQSSLEHDPGNPRVIREASRLLVKHYCTGLLLDRTDRSYVKTVVDLILEIASLRHSAALHASQT